MVKQYKILRAKYPFELSEEVEKNLERGWKLQGGVSSMTVPTGILGPDPEYCQAMVKE